MMAKKYAETGGKVLKVILIILGLLVVFIAGVFSAYPVMTFLHNIFG